MLELVYVQFSSVVAPGGHQSPPPSYATLKGPPSDVEYMTIT